MWILKRKLPYCCRKLNHVSSTEVFEANLISHRPLQVMHNAKLFKKNWRQSGVRICQLTGYGLGERGSVPGRYKRFTSYPKCPERLWGPRSSLGEFSPVLNARGVKLPTHFHLVLRLRMSGDIPLLRHMPYLSNMQSACAVLYCRLWPLRLYSIFPHHVINGTIFRKKKRY